MPISLNGGGFGSRRRGGASLSEINVTPFVDVVLVLLIIFMLTAHVMEFGIEVDVPKVRTVKESAQEMPVVTIDRKSTRLNSSHLGISYAVFCLKKKKKQKTIRNEERLSRITGATRNKSASF